MAPASEPAAAGLGDGDRARALVELYDLLVHGLAALNIQVGAALALLGHDSLRARDALLAVSVITRQVMGEVRRLGVLVGGDAPPAYAPQPGVAEAVAFVVPGAVQLAAFRMVEAALDALQDAAAPELTVRVTPTHLELDVAASGAAASWDAEQLLRTRVALYGARVQSLRIDGVGLALRARLALDAGAAMNVAPDTTNG